jgi:aryl-alcohol dehydrogenase-like predicted oxidoreductase
MTVCVSWVVSAGSGSGVSGRWSARMPSRNIVRYRRYSCGATARVALARITAQGQCVVPIPGTRTREYLTENGGAGQLILDPHAIRELDALPAPVGNRC